MVISYAYSPLPWKSNPVSSLQIPPKSTMIGSIRKNWFKMGNIESPPGQRILSPLNLENQSWSLSIKHLVFYISVYSSDCQHMCIYSMYSLCCSTVLGALILVKLFWAVQEAEMVIRWAPEAAQSRKQNHRRESRMLRWEETGGGEGGGGPKGKLRRMNECSGLFWQLLRISHRGGTAQDES